MNAMRLVPVLLLIWGCSTFAAPPDAAWFPKAPPLPKPDGELIQVENVKQLQAALDQVKRGGTIMVADGHYKLDRYIEIKTDGVTLRSASGDRDKVILDGASSQPHPARRGSHRKSRASRRRRPNGRRGPLCAVSPRRRG
jgi:hypothetical protein